MSVFAYGSLVNVTSLPFPITTRQGTVRGFVRQWRNWRTSGNDRVCALTLERRARASVEGLVIEGGERLHAYLAERESQEEQMPVRAFCGTQPVHALTFVARADRRGWPTAHWPIWLSYVDCVLQGYFREFGEPGLDRFMSTTEGWDRAPIVDDRAFPLYPRPVALNDDERNAIDQRLVKVGVLRRA